MPERWGRRADRASPELQRQPFEIRGLRPFRLIGCGFRKRQPGRLGGRYARVQISAHRAHALLVGLRVEPEAAARAQRLEQPVALLPGAQQLGRDADSTAQRPDAEVCRRRAHDTSLHQLSTNT